MFGKLLKATRLKKGITQQELADLCMVSVRQIIRYEQGEQEPLVSTALMLAKALGVSLDYLCGYTDNPSPSFNDNE